MSTLVFPDHFFSVKPFTSDRRRRRRRRRRHRHHNQSPSSREPRGTAMAFQIAVRGEIVPGFIMVSAGRSPGGLLRSGT